MCMGSFYFWQRRWTNHGNGKLQPGGRCAYAYLAGEIDHDAAQSLRIQLDDALVSRAPQTMILDFGGSDLWIHPV